MNMKIHYEIERLIVSNPFVPIHITEQWDRVFAESARLKLGELSRSRLALNLVDYVTSEDLPRRLLVTRAPQCMAALGKERKIYKDFRVINGRKGGVVYSGHDRIIPNKFEYEMNIKAKRIVDGTSQSLSSSDLLNCLKNGDIVTSLDGILFLDCKRVAADIARLRKKHPELDIEMKRIEVSDSLTNTTRKMASYRLKS
jgi:hypothetical protein